MRAAVSEQVSETMQGSGAGSKDMAPVPVAVQYWAIGTVFGEKKVLMDKAPVGQRWSPVWCVPMASGVWCPCRTGRSKGSCASCGCL